VRIYFSAVVGVLSPAATPSIGRMRKSIERRANRFTTTLCGAGAAQITRSSDNFIAEAQTVIVNSQL